MKKAAVDAHAFADAMSKVSKVLRKSVIPILGEIAVSIGDDRCTLTATDLGTWLVAELPARGDDMSFVFRRTKDILKACACLEGEMEIILRGEEETHAKNLKLELCCERRRAEFAVTSREDYPDCPSIEGNVPVRVNAAELFRRIERVRYAAEKGDPDKRPRVTCIQFQGDRVFSLDGYRMACDTQPEVTFPVPFLAHEESLAHLKVFGDSEITVEIGAYKVSFSSGALKLIVRRYGADTFDLDDALPKIYQEVIAVRTEELIRELTYLKGCAGNTAAPYVRFAGEELSVNLPSGHFATSVSLSGRGELTIGFDLHYMLEALKQFRKEPEVRLKLSGRYSPIVIEAEGRSDFALVLPVRLREESAA